MESPNKTNSGPNKPNPWPKKSGSNKLLNSANGFKELQQYNDNFDNEFCQQKRYCENIESNAEARENPPTGKLGTAVRGFFSWSKQHQKITGLEDIKTNICKTRSTTKNKVTRSMSDAQEIKNKKHDFRFQRKPLMRTKSCHRDLLPSMMNKSYRLSMVMIFV